MSEIDGFADLVSKLSEAEKLLAKMDKHVEDMSKNAKEFGGNISGAAGSKGGQKRVGQGGKGNITGSSQGSGSMPAVGKQTTATLGLGAFGAAIGAVGNKIGSETRFGKTMGNFGGAIGRFADSGGMLDPVGALGIKGRQRDENGKVIPGADKVSLFNSLSPEQQERIGSSMYGISDALTLFKNISSASSSFMPNIGDAMNRATRYYNATTYGGNKMSRKAVQSATYGTMQGLNGITSAGSDAAVAQFLSARGMAPSTDSSGVYQQTLRTVANAGRYMNISNEDAARSVESLTNARGSADMLRNFGIYTADLNTGKEKTQGQIFKELADRLTAGRGKATVEQTQQSIRRGSLGVTVDAFFGGDQQGAQMFKQYMIERAGGKTMDLSQNSRMDATLGNGGNLNPLDAQMTIAGKQTGAFGAAEDEYIAGINTATKALSALTDAAGNIAKVMGGANALIQTLMGNEQFKGAVGGLTSLVDFGSKGLSGIFTAARQMNPAGWAEAGIIGASMGVTLGAAAGIGVGAEALSRTGANPSGGAINSSISGMGGMGIGGTVVKGGGGALSSSFSMGDYSQTPGMSTATQSADTSGALFNVDWLGSYGKTSEYGVHDDAHQTYAHTGTDFSMPSGAEVKAVGDGTVVDIINQPRNVYTGGVGMPAGATGNMIRIQHTSQDGKTYYSLYMHLSEILVTKGQTVTQGQVIGRSGNTGNSSGPHLHLEFQDEKRKPIPYTTALALIGGKNAAANSQQFGMNKDTLEAGMKLTAGLAKVPVASQNAFNILQGLYSGDTATILASIAAMPTTGVNAETLQQYINAPDVSQIAPGSTGTPGASSGAVNNVSITVQVPDVTSADALKFAQLVRTYLQNDTLMSTTGSV